MVTLVIDISKASGTNRLHPLNASVRQYITDRVRSGLDDAQVTSMVLTGGVEHFSAGADLSEMRALLRQQQSTSSTTTTKTTTIADFIAATGNTAPSLIDVVDVLESSTKPIVAAIAGTCMGGGLELALACHYRVAVAGSTMALPEVKVGLIPGAGGTQRLPKLIGLAAATQLILTGQSVKITNNNNNNKLASKLVDAVVSSPDLLESTAVRWAQWAEVLPSIRRLGLTKGVSEPPFVAHNILHQAWLALPRHPEARVMGEAALRALRAASTNTLTLPNAMAVESQAFLDCLTSSSGQALRHVFFAIRQAQTLVPAPVAVRKSALQHALLSKQNSQQQPKYAAVIGAGTMGSGIALVLLLGDAQFHVTLVDVNPQGLAKGVQLIRKVVETRVQRGKLSPKAGRILLEQRLRSTTQLSEIGSSCQLVVEAVVENLALKQQIFRQLERVVSKDCLLLSNTSTLSVDAMASVLQYQHRFAGWHFFSPAHVMQLVEIVRADATSALTLTILQLLSKRLGKTAVVVGNCDGFCGNRLLKPYSGETVMLLTERAETTPALVDAALKQDFGMALGPLEMGDLAGNDVGFFVRKERGWARGSREEPIPANRPERYNELADVLVSVHKRLGQKTAQGWFDYDPAIGKGRVPLESPAVAKIMANYKTPRTDLTPRPSATEMIEQVLFPLVNEGLKCLEEGIVRCPSDVDIVYVFGYGWPVWRGGPLYWADHTVGLPYLLQRLREMTKLFPTTAYFRPSKLLETCVAQGITVEEYYARQNKKNENNPQSKL